LATRLPQLLFQGRLSALLGEVPLQALHSTAGRRRTLRHLVMDCAGDATHALMGTEQLLAHCLKAESAGEVHMRGTVVVAVTDSGGFDGGAGQGCAGEWRGGGTCDVGHAEAFADFRRPVPGQWPRSVDRGAPRGVTTRAVV